MKSLDRILQRYWDNVEALRIYTSMMRPVAMSEFIKDFAEFFKGLLPLKDSADADEAEIGRQADQFITDFSNGIKGTPSQVSSKNPSDSDTERQKQTIASFTVDETKLTASQAAEYRNIGLKMQTMELLHRSALVTLVSFFEVLLADIFHQYYRLHPQALSGDDKVLSLNELKAYGSVEEAIEESIQHRVESLLRGNLDDWRQLLQRQLKIDLTKLVPGQWAEWAEAFQRRNLLVHNDGQVNRIYLSKVAPEYISSLSPSPKLGQRIEVSSDYLDLALDAFVIVGVTLTDQVWEKMAGHDRQERDESLQQVIWQCVTADRMQIAERLSQHASERPCINESMRLTFRITYWLSMKRQNRWGEIAPEVSAFDTTACHPRFAICVHALRGDAIAFYRDLPLALSSIKRSELWESPMFAEIRSRADFETTVSALIEQSQSVPNVLQRTRPRRAKPKKQSGSSDKLED